MPQISVSVKNSTGNDYNTHVYDLFAVGRREVNGSPFALANDEQSNAFIVYASAGGRGNIEYACDGGPSLSGNDCGKGRCNRNPIAVLASTHFVRSAHDSCPIHTFGQHLETGPIGDFD